MSKPRETALYTYDMLITLGQIAFQQKQTRLAALIEAAAAEAKAIGQKESVY